MEMKSDAIKSPRNNSIQVVSPVSKNCVTEKKWDNQNPIYDHDLTFTLFNNP